jgi:TatD DNase family protein
MFDTHIHLTDAAFDPDRAEVIARARDAGVEGFLTMGIDLASSRAAVALAAREPGVFAAVGIHPTEVKSATSPDFDEVRRLAEDGRGAAGKVVAIGETGLDYYWDASNADEQKRALAWHLALARDLDLPIILHNRSSHRDLIGVLDAFAAENGGTIRGVLHCFSGDDAYREAGVRLGLHFGFGGTLTYRKSTGPADIRLVPPNRILLETDAPYLPPVPHRGARNEPAYIRHVLSGAAVALSRDPAETDALTTGNARSLLRLP